MLPPKHSPGFVFTACRLKTTQKKLIKFPMIKVKHQMSALNKSPVGNNVDVSGVRSNISNGGNNNAGSGAGTTGGVVATVSKFGKHFGKFKVALVVVGAVVICMTLLKLNKKKQSMARARGGGGGGGASSGIKKLVNLGLGNTNSAEQNGDDSGSGNK